jgi:hypothetical protein
MGHRNRCRRPSLFLSPCLHHAPPAHLLNDNSALPSVHQWSTCAEQPGLCLCFPAGGTLS